MGNLKDYSDVLTPEEVGKFLNIGMNKVYELLKNRKIRSIKIGQQYRIPKPWLKAFLFDLQVA